MLLNILRKITGQKFNFFYLNERLNYENQLSQSRESSYSAFSHLTKY